MWYIDRPLESQTSFSSSLIKEQYMKRIIIHVLMVIVGATVGDAFLPEFWVLINQRQFQNNIVVNSFIGALIFLIFSIVFIRLLLNFVDKIDKAVATINIPTITLVFFGGVLGLVVGAIASLPLWILRIPILSTIIPFLLMTQQYRDHLAAMRLRLKQLRAA